jgi:steroid 5-alpha reductase family enzyme
MPLVPLSATLGVTLVAFTLLWATSLRRRDAGIVDFYWGPGFVVIAWIGLATSPSRLVSDLWLLVPVTLWGLRLGWYMIERHGGEEDARYAAMRARHGAAFPSRSLWMVFWLQAVIQWLAASPSLALAATSSTGKAQAAASSLGGIALWFGVLLFSIGFVVEVMADRAVRRFKADPANRGLLLTTGLHGFVRHPNYLGEIVLQWGLGFVAFGLTLNPLAFAGPALMHALIVKLSGVPMLQDHLASRPGHAEWAARTPALWPRLGR